MQYRLRTLLLIVTVLAMTLGAWRATDRYAENERDALLVDTYAIAPLVISRDDFDLGERRYYLWLLVGDFRMPFVSSLPKRENAGTYP
jgi:hypothetical protein